MLIINLNLDKNGDLTRQDKACFGGEYIFFEKVKRSGIGSGKVIYKSGIPEFDAIARGVENELGFVNFELLKNGLIIRLNQNQRIKCVGIKITDVRAINLTASRIEIEYKQHVRMVKKIVYRGELEIIDEQDYKTGFEVFARDYEDVRRFFQKIEFEDKFRHSMSLNPPEKDRGHLLDLMKV